MGVASREREERKKERFSISIDGAQYCLNWGTQGENTANEMHQNEKKSKRE